MPKSPWRTFGKIALILGASFFIVFAVFGILCLTNGKSGAFPVLALSFGINAATWLVLGIVFTLKAYRARRKLNRLRRDGLRFAAEVVRMVPSPYVRIGGTLTVHAECRYRNHEGKLCLVKSESFLVGYDLVFGNGEKLMPRATVFVNEHDPKDYAVEIVTTGSGDAEYDYDYR